MGTNITVRVSGDDTFINDARIVHANLVLPNGVAHVLDRVSLGVARYYPFLYLSVEQCKPANAVNFGERIRSLPRPLLLQFSFRARARR